MYWWFSRLNRFFMVSNSAWPHFSRERQHLSDDRDDMYGTKLLGLAAGLVMIECHLALEMGPEKVRYRARVAYHGGSFAGFQLQSHKKQQRTVQGVLETAIQQSFGMIGNRSIKVVGAGRTDSGVHARGQAIHFDGPSVSVSTLSDVQNTLEGNLPSDVVVWDMQVAPSTVRKIKDGFYRTFPWNVMFESTHKIYVYRLSLGPVMDPVEQHWRWHVPFYRDVDIEELERVLQLFVGNHDFRAFASAEIVGTSSARRVYSVQLIDEGNEDNYRIEFSLKGALYKQVRNMAGAALQQARRDGKHSKKVDVQQLLATGAPRTDNPAQPAPPQGLTLERVYFDDF